MIRAFRRLRDAVTMTVPEPIDAAAYRRAFALAWACIPLAALNLGGYFALRAVPGSNLEVYRRFLIANLPWHGLCLGVAVAARHLTLSEVALRRLMKLEIVSAHLTICTAALMSYGTARMTLNTILAVLLVVLARGAMDEGLGLFSLATASVLLGGVVLGQASPLLAIGALDPGQVDPLLRGGAGRMLVLGWGVGAYVTAWGVTSYVVKRIRETDWILASERAARRKLEQRVAERESGGRAGTTLPPGYFLRELLGRGAMGEVYEATSPDDGTTVAVKVLNTHLASSPAMLARFRREADILARLPASCATRIQAFGTTAEGEPFFVMERLRGEDLGALLRRRRYLPLEEALPLVEALARALAAAHAAGVVHRDLKPQNVFVQDQPRGESGSIRLLDFGISRLSDETEGLTQAQWVLGSPGYLAPEQARGIIDQIGPHTDVFALGAVVYRMITGQNAFPARDMAGAVFEAVNISPPPPSSIRSELSPAVDAVLAIALAKPIQRRYATATELAHDLRRAAAGELPSERFERARDVAAVAELERTLTGVSD